jgi:hypothetical protein
MPPPPGSRRSAAHRNLWKGATRSTVAETSIDGFTVRVTMSAILSSPVMTDGKRSEEDI